MPWQNAGKSLRRRQGDADGDGRYRDRALPWRRWSVGAFLPEEEGETDKHDRGEEEHQGQESGLGQPAGIGSVPEVVPHTPEEAGLGSSAEVALIGLIEDRRGIFPS